MKKILWVSWMVVVLASITLGCTSGNNEENHSDMDHSQMDHSMMDHSQRILNFLLASKQKSRLVMIIGPE